MARTTYSELFTGASGLSDGSVVGFSEALPGNGEAMLLSLLNPNNAQIILQYRFATPGKLNSGTEWADSGYAVSGSVQIINIFFPEYEYRARVIDAPSSGRVSFSARCLYENAYENDNFLKLLSSEIPVGFPSNVGSSIAVIGSGSSGVGGSSDQQPVGFAILNDSADPTIYYMTGYELVNGSPAPFYFTMPTGSKVAGLPPATATPTSGFGQTMNYAEAMASNFPIVVVNDPDPEIADEFDGIWWLRGNDRILNRNYDASLSGASLVGINPGTGGGGVTGPTAGTVDLTFITSKSGNFQPSVVLKPGFTVPTWIQPDGTTSASATLNTSFPDNSNKTITLRLETDSLDQLNLAQMNIESISIPEFTGLKRLILTNNTNAKLTDAEIIAMPNTEEVRVCNTASVITDASIADKNLKVLDVCNTASIPSNAGLAATTAPLEINLGASRSTISATLLRTYSTLEKLNIQAVGPVAALTNVDTANWGAMKSLLVGYSVSTLTDFALVQMPNLEELQAPSSNCVFTPGGLSQCPKLKVIDVSGCVSDPDGVIALYAGGTITGGRLTMVGNTPPRTGLSNGNVAHLITPISDGGLGWIVSANT